MTQSDLRHYSMIGVYLRVTGPVRLTLWHNDCELLRRVSWILHCILKLFVIAGDNYSRASSRYSMTETELLKLPQQCNYDADKIKQHGEGKRVPSLVILLE